MLARKDLETPDVIAAQAEAPRSRHAVRARRTRADFGFPCEGSRVRPRHGHKKTGRGEGALARHSGSRPAATTTDDPTNRKSTCDRRHLRAPTARCSDCRAAESESLSASIGWSRSAPTTSRGSASSYHPAAGCSGLKICGCAGPVTSITPIMPLRTARVSAWSRNFT